MFIIFILIPQRPTFPSLPNQVPVFPYIIQFGCHELLNVTFHWRLANSPGATPLKMGSSLLVAIAASSFLATETQQEV